jgi:hypothetical protein
MGSSLIALTLEISVMSSISNSHSPQSITLKPMAQLKKQMA